MTYRSPARALLAATAALAVALPAPPAYADQIRDMQWHLRFLDVNSAHGHSQGDGVVVAVVDSGVDATHPDLAGAVLPGVDLNTGAGNGHTDQVGHGTAMAGLIAARGRGPDTGALGIAPKATILPVRTRARVVTLGLGDATIPGIEWATTHGAKVICFAGAGDHNDPQLRRAIEAALRADIVVVAGVGNRPDHTRVMWPAAYPGVVAAAGVDRDGSHAEVSVTGPEAVLAAPAVDIASTDRGGRGYWGGTGTSNATAIIAGAAALVRSRYPHLSAPEVVHRLTATATDKGPAGRDDQYGYGVVNLVAALTADVPPPTPSASPSAVGGDRPTSDAAAPTPRGRTTVWLFVIAFGLMLAGAAIAALVVSTRRTGDRHG